MKIGRRGSMTAHFTAQGVQGHSAYPQRAKNPLHGDGDGCWTGWPREPLDAAPTHFDASTLAITTIDSGNPANNVIPARAKATVNIRFNDAHTGGEPVGLAEGPRRDGGGRDRRGDRRWR